MVRRMIDSLGVLVLYCHQTRCVPGAQLTSLSCMAHTGLGVEKDMIAAAFYLDASAEVAALHFHATGEQPMHEFQR